jgi:amidohydrolase
MYPSVINHPGVTALLAETAYDVVGAQNVEESPLLMVSEDYSYYLEKTPGTFFFVGCGCKDKETDYPHHSPRFNIDDDVLPIATTIFSAFAFRALDKLNAGEIGKQLVHR